MKPAEIRALDRLLDRIDYYRLLRVDRVATASDIRTGYHKMRRELHPDRYLAEDPAIQQALDRIARRLNEAYVVLRDATRRTAYDRGLAPLTYGLDSAQAAGGFGFGFTWPAAFPMARIDHILVRGVHVADARVLPRTGSDHRPISADLEL